MRAFLPSRETATAVLARAYLVLLPVLAAWYVIGGILLVQLTVENAIAKGVAQGLLRAGVCQ